MDKRYTQLEGIYLGPFTVKKHVWFTCILKIVSIWKKLQLTVSIFLTSGNNVCLWMDGPLFLLSAVNPSKWVAFKSMLIKIRSLNIISNFKACLCGDGCLKQPVDYEYAGTVFQEYIAAL